MRTSYGFIQDELYNKIKHEKSITPVRDKVDEKHYVKDCVHYFVRKVKNFVALVSMQ